MSAKDSSLQLRIASPCNMDWDSMVGNDRVRFCEHCQLSVHNIDLSSQKQIRRLIARSSGRLCVSYRQPDPRSEMTPPLLYKIGRRTSAIAAGAFSATLGITSAMAASTDLNRAAFSNEVVAAASVVDRFASFGGGTLRGLVFDPNGAVITGANVSVTNSETNEQLYAISGSDGEFRFAELKPGSYHLKIRATGFETRDVPSISLREGDDNRVDQTLSIAPIAAEVTVTAPEGTGVMSGGAMISLPSDPLVIAAMQDDLEALKNVLLTRSSPDARDKETQATALEFAVRNANREMVQELLWAKVDVNARDRDGQTVLMLLNEKVTSEIIWDLINAGAKVNLRDKEGDTALMSAAEINNVDALKALLDAGAKVNASNNAGETALMQAAESGWVNNVRLLLLAGADVNARDENGQSALRRAFLSGESAVTRLLKSHGAIEFEGPEKQ